MYELLRPTPEENHLFSTQRGESAERHGAIGLIKVSFGTHGRYPDEVWVDHHKRLKTTAFKHELGGLLDFLRGGVFSELDPSGEYHWRRSARGLFDRNGWGLKVRTEDYSFYIRCLPHISGMDTLIYAYDNCYLLPQLADKHQNGNPQPPPPKEPSRERG